VRCLIFGAGAIGSFVGALLSRGHDVTVVARGAHVERIRSDGLVIRGRTELVAHPRAVERLEELTGGDAASPDVVIVTVKSQDTAAAAQALEPFWSSSLFLSLQSGLGNADVLAEKADHVLAGITNNLVSVVGPGEIEHVRGGTTVFGPFKGAFRDDAKALAVTLEECGLRSMVTVDGLRTAL
jgi:2-dehydropantoate 2-reductase